MCREATANSRKPRSHASKGQVPRTRKRDDWWWWALKSLETRELSLVAIQARRATCDDRDAGTRPAARTQIEVQCGRREQQGVEDGSNGCAMEWELLTWWMGGRLVREGGLSGGLGRKEEKFAAKRGRTEDWMGVGGLRHGPPKPAPAPAPPAPPAPRSATQHHPLWLANA